VERRTFTKYTGLSGRRPGHLPYGTARDVNRVESMESTPRNQPLVVYDGDCGFCRGWVARWRAQTGDTVDYKPFQELEEPFEGYTHEHFAQWAYLFDTDGRVYRGAGAVLRTVSYVPGRGLPLWCYEHVPGARRVFDTGYRLVADNRNAISKLTRFLWGDHSIPPTYVVVRSIFLRLLGVVYLIAFASLAVQITTLAGAQGITPAGEYLAYAHERLGDDAYRRVPTLFWLGVSDDALVWTCWAGVAVAALLVVGMAPIVTTAVLWAMYLSLVAIGGVFLQFQWDSLLLEAGLLAIFFSPWRLFLGTGSGRPSPIILWLYRWLVFRLMFLSGMVKLHGGDPNTWRELTALDYHYWTQPLPHVGSWYVHHFPSWFHEASLVTMFAIELVCPFLIFGPRRVRHVAGVSFILLMVAVAITGNYTFFNLLTAVLCLTLFDDQALRRALRLGQHRSTLVPRKLRCVLARAAIHVPVAAVILVVSFCSGRRRLDRAFEVPEPIMRIMRTATPLRSINTYGLFARMTTTRPEIILEGSDDGRTWEAYEFNWKPGDVMRAPGWVQPHQPRVDWQLWFAAMGSYRQPRNRFVTDLMRRVLEGSPDVLKLFSVNPFPDDPPRYLRAVRYHYQFSDPETRAETGAWWVRRDPAPYAPVLSRERRPPRP